MPGFCLHRMGKAQIAGSAHRGWGGGTCSGFAAPLNEPYGWFGDGGGFAACRGVLTLWCYAGKREGSALRAVAARLQAEQVPPPRVTFVDARAAEALRLSAGDLRDGRMRLRLSAVGACSSAGVGNVSLGRSGGGGFACLSAGSLRDGRNRLRLFAEVRLFLSLR